MNPAHLHLLLNHIPLPGTLCGLAELLRFRGSGELPRWFVTACLILSIVVVGIVVVGMLACTSNLRGRIRHSETRPGFQSSVTAE